MTGRTDREVADAVAAASDTAAPKLGLRFDRVVVRVLEQLKAFVDDNGSEDLSVLLTLTAPVRAPKKTVVALEREISALLQNSCFEIERSMVVHGNRAQLRLVRLEPKRGHGLLGFVHNPDVDALMILNLAERWLQSGA